VKKVTFPIDLLAGMYIGIMIASFLLGITRENLTFNEITFNGNFLRYFLQE
jgi:hypothetical protein